jgi:predicted dehydrogenase
LSVAAGESPVAAGESPVAPGESPVSLRACVVGTSFGARIHVPALRLAGFEIVALVGVDSAKTARRVERLGLPPGAACNSLAEALALGVDVVSIATPPATHAPLAAEAIAGHCHVLCEKPFTLDAAEARQLADAASTAGVVAMLGHEFRWSSAQATIEWTLAQGRIGTPKMAVSASFISMLRSFPMADWWYDPAQGGGWLNASGSHRIDALRQWFGEIEAVSGGLPAVCEPALGVDDSFNIRCVMRNGVDVALVQSSAAAGPGASMTRVVGAEGTLWIKGDTVYVGTDATPDGEIVEPPPKLVLPDVDALATGALAEMTRTELPPYIRLAEAFRAAIEGVGGPGTGGSGSGSGTGSGLGSGSGSGWTGPRAATFDDGVACIRVLDAVRQSAADGGRWTAVDEVEVSG